MSGNLPWFVAFVLFATFSATAAIGAQKDSPTPTPSKAATTDPERTANQNELEAMKADLQRMRSLLSQMQTNLAFVGSTTTPLNHEFELQVEMWRILIGHMERHVQEMEKRGKT